MLKATNRRCYGDGDGVTCFVVFEQPTIAKKSFPSSSPGTVDLKRQRSSFHIKQLLLRFEHVAIDPVELMKMATDIVTSI